jgi:mono/diheme cytochrome c family protein/Tfp pilus assembly protein PilF
MFGPRGYALWAKQTAAHGLRIGAISEAQWHLRRAAWAAPDDGGIDLMSAFCFRQFRQLDRWQAALRTAEEKGAPQAQIQRERELYRIQAGDWPDGTESRLALLAGEGVTDYDVPAAFVAGALASGRNGLAQRLLDAWNADCPNDAHVAHMRGKYWESLGNTAQARAEYEAAISLEPRHEPAHVSLAKFFEENDQLPQAFRQYAAIASASPACEAAAAGAARVLRKMGDLDRAQAILEPLARTGEPTMEIAADMGRIAMDRGDSSGAEQWFHDAGLERTHDPNLLMSALRLRGIQGKPAEAERLFQRVAALGDRVTRLRELRIRLDVDPGDAGAAREAEKLHRDLRELTSAKALPAEPAADEKLPPGRRLFALHCRVCHGPDGRGNGLAARHLFPPPRDLRWEPSRLVSTTNGTPTLDDTITMLRRGVPGTSMPSFDKREDNELRLLAEEVFRLRREGVRERLVEVLKRQGEDVVEDDVERSVNVLTSPGEPIVVPPIGISSRPSVRRGQAVYAQQGCAKCHGEDGAGVADQTWYDERGFPERARDLVREPLKGGQDATAVCLRIAAGMPGSPHPSSRGLSPQQTVDLVQFCLSLSREPKLVLTDHQRAELAAGQDYLAAIRRE